MILALTFTPIAIFSLTVIIRKVRNVNIIRKDTYSISYAASGIQTMKISYANFDNIRSQQVLKVSSSKPIIEDQTLRIYRRI